MPQKILTVHSDDPDAFGAQEAAGFGTMARRIGDALQTARRHETFANAKASYDELLRAQRDGVLLVREGKVVRANPAAAALLGYPYPELMFDLDPAAILAGGGAAASLRAALRGPVTGTGGWKCGRRRCAGGTAPCSRGRSPSRGSRGGTGRSPSSPPAAAPSGW
jgi:PAS domain-containing protein